MDLSPVTEEARKTWPHSESPRRPSGIPLGLSTQLDDGTGLMHFTEKEEGKGEKGKGVMKASKGRPTKRTSPQKVVPPNYMAETITSVTKKSPRVARSSSVTHIPPEKKEFKSSKAAKHDPLHAVSAAELRARLESLQTQKISTRLKVAEVLDVGSSEESSPQSSKAGVHHHLWQISEAAQLPGIARFYGDQVPFLSGAAITFTAPISPTIGHASQSPAIVSTGAARSPGPTSPVTNSKPPEASAPPAQPPVLSLAAAIASEADKHPVDKPTGPEAYVLELEKKVKSLQNAINVLHLERSTAQERANILEAHCKRITYKWEADRNRMLEMESKLSGSKSDGGDDGADSRKSSNFVSKTTEQSWDAMRTAELEHMRAENARLRDENALLKRRIVSLNADIETQSHLVKQRTKSVVPELKVLRRRIADLEAENEELMALAKKSKPFDDLDVGALIKEHAELRAATNELLLQHDKVCSDYLALHDALGIGETMPEDSDTTLENATTRMPTAISEDFLGDGDPA